MEPQISVIIPVYNAHKYISKCLDSILAQENTDYEVILVNDGSTDNSANICREYAAQDNRIHLIEKENGGVSSARNCGLAQAKGKFVIFIDADDFISPDYLTIDDCYMDCDVVEKAFVEYNTDKSKVTKRYDKKRDVVMTDKKAFLTHFVSFRNNAMWDKFISRETIADTLFDETLKVGEDMIFCASIAHRFRSYGISTKGTYYYRKHDDSIMTHTLNDRTWYLNNLFLLVDKIHSCCKCSQIATGIIARYNIAKLFRRRKYLNESQRQELRKIFDGIGFQNITYLNLKWKIKFFVKKYHYMLES